MKQAILNFYRSNHIYNYRKEWVLLISCFVFVLLRIPSLIEPHWYGDEGIYQVIGRALNDGRILYRDIWDNKPPLLYIIYAFSFGNLFAVKLLSLLAGLGSIIFFFKLVGKIFKKEVSIFICTILYALLFGAPILEGNIANAENFMLLPVVASSYFIFTYSQKNGYKNLAIAGFLLSLALMTKIVAIFDFLAFAIFLVYTIGFRKNLRHLSIFSICFLSVFAAFIIYFLIMGTFNESMSSIFMQNIAYVGEQNGANNPIAAFISKVVVLVIVVIVLSFRKVKVGRNLLFIYLWFVFGVYSSMFSARPYTHYLLVILPSFSLLFGMIFETRKMRAINIILIALLSLIGYFHFKIYRKNILYYVNAFQMVTGSKSITDYEMFFDKNTPRDYNIANFIKSNIKNDESIFLWSDSPQIYALSNKLPIGKYIVAYHITFYKNADIITKEQLNRSQPRYIIQTVNEPLGEELISSYKLKYIMEGTKIYEREI